jgi:hypothetical protein
MRSSAESTVLSSSASASSDARCPTCRAPARCSAWNHPAPTIALTAAILPTTLTEGRETGAGARRAARRRRRRGLAAHEPKPLDRLVVPHLPLPHPKRWPSRADRKPGGVAGEARGRFCVCPTESPIVWAHPSHICTGTGLALPHLDWAHPSGICSAAARAPPQHLLQDDIHGASRALGGELSHAVQCTASADAMLVDMVCLCARLYGRARARTHGRACVRVHATIRVRASTSVPSLRGWGCACGRGCACVGAGGGSRAPRAHTLADTSP